MQPSPAILARIVSINLSFFCPAPRASITIGYWPGLFFSAKTSISAELLSPKTTVSLLKESSESSEKVVVPPQPSVSITKLSFPPDLIIKMSFEKETQSTRFTAAISTSIFPVRVSAPVSVKFVAANSITATAFPLTPAFGEKVKTAPWLNSLPILFETVL